ncbi:MAG: tRNA (adenosine(37)-N6)-dimethylallyltransferase MiaA [Burkholderiales bacterium]|nr:tRNA (adenosine(37)-N6)-dimethylallyltransferase MiaA [Burkholderiales bacterium]
MANPDGDTLPFYLCLAGPTASGKTAAAMAIAQHHACEIISVDSALVYRGMDIGTAKPSAQELAQVPHHLINIRDPLQAYSAAEFVRDARGLIAEIAARGKLPLLVGGTMLYFKALFDGLDDMPAADPAIRAQLELEATAKGWPAMHAELAQVDPVTAARLAPLDSQRVQRALEVYRISGLPLSHFHSTKDATKTVAAHANSTGARALISLEPLERSWLHERIAQRFDTMLEQGFVDEVRALRARGDLHADLPSMRCVGYRQVWEALDAHATSGLAGPLPLADIRERGIIATRQLAKRQITWLRSMPQRQVIQADAADALGDVLDLVRKVLG